MNETFDCSQKWPARHKPVENWSNSIDAIKIKGYEKRETFTFWRRAKDNEIKTTDSRNGANGNRALLTIITFSLIFFFTFLWLTIDYDESAQM
jgi:hypothetical protein